MKFGDDSAFLMIVGAPKSATTTLAHWLSTHPGMAVSDTKEPRYFTDFGQYEWTGPGGQYFSDTLARDEAAYLQSFHTNSSATWAVDASTDYLWCDASPDLIKAWAGRFRTKLICVLRDPVDRAFSEYQHSIRDNLETETFARSLDLEDERFAQHWHPLFYHVRRSRYLEGVTRYHALFGDDLMIMDFREFFDPVTCAAKVTGFLGLDQPVEPSNERENASFVYNRPGIARLIKGRTATKIGRALVPKRFRKGIRAGIDNKLSARYERQEADIKRLRAVLADEITACEASPLIPTGGWKTALPAQTAAVSA